MHIFLHHYYWVSYLVYAISLVISSLWFSFFIYSILYTGNIYDINNILMNLNNNLGIKKNIQIFYKRLDVLQLNIQCLYTHTSTLKISNGIDKRRESQWFQAMKCLILHSYNEWDKVTLLHIVKVYCVQQIKCTQLWIKISATLKYCIKRLA